MEKELEEKILVALYRYYLQDISFEKVAEEIDAVEGKQKVKELMKKIDNNESG